DSNTTLVVPANMTEVSGLITSAMKMMQVGKSV
ncbi:MAG: band-7 C-terminal domain-containing protein, partial [Comamonas sp.]